MSVIGGFLGSGKTTLLNRILAGSHGVRYAVLVNDFGELAVDGRLVAAHDGETITFANGCVCCSMGGDLVGALDRLLDGNRPPDQILVEASGVADPCAIADVATLHPGLSRDLVVVLADVETVRARYEDHRLRDTVMRQLAAANLLVLNKCDRVARKEIEAAESWARDRSQAPAIRSVDADIPMGLLCAAPPEVSLPSAAGGGGAQSPASAPAAIVPAPGVRTDELAAPTRGPGPDRTAATRLPTEPAFPVRADVPDPGPREHAPDHSHRFASRFVPCPNPVDRGRLCAALSALLPRVLRAKGFIVCADGVEQEWMVVQACGRTVDLERWHPPPDRALPDPGIVFIGLDDLPAGDELAAVLSQASSEASPPSPSPPAAARAT